MELITIGKNDLLELLNQANQPLLEKISNLEAEIKSLKSPSKQFNCSKAADYLGIKRGHLVAISYIEGEEKPTERKQYPCTRLGFNLVYSIEVLDKIRLSLKNELIEID